MWFEHPEPDGSVPRLREKQTVVFTSEPLSGYDTCHDVMHNPCTSVDARYAKNPEIGEFDPSCSLHTGWASIIEGRGLDTTWNAYVTRVVLH